MANCKACKCGCRRIMSNAVKNMMNDGCFDVCTNPICGSPDKLSILAPLIYDEIGINLCTSFVAGTDLPATATSASARVIDMEYTYGAGNVVITQLAGRPNCYGVTLTNIDVTFAVTLYDDNCNALTTVYPVASYLPSDITAPTYDEDTNPSSVTMEIFAPYGIGYTAAGTTPETYTPALNFMGLVTTDNMPRQGLNMYGIPKVLGYDSTDGTITVGLTLVVQSMYYAGYMVNSAGKIHTPKGSIITPENSDCMKFVAGDLLNLAIKPLDLSGRTCPFDIKNDCEESCVDDCIDNDGILTQTCTEDSVNSFDAEINGNYNMNGNTQGGFRNR